MHHSGRERFQDVQKGHPSALDVAVFDLERVKTPDPIDLFAVALQAGLEPTLWLQPIDGFSLVGIGSAWSVCGTQLNMTGPRGLIVKPSL